MLKPGARVAIVTPSGVPDPGRLARSLDLLRAWGLDPVLGPHVGAVHRYTAGPVAARAADLRWALTDPAIDAVWFGRGGFGTAHLLDGLPRGALDDRPILGFSDATALFCALAAAGAGRPVHGPVVHSLADLVDDDSKNALRAWMAGEPVRLPGKSLGPFPGEVVAPVVGGNLCVLASLCGTPWAPRFAGKILLIEEIGEAPYKIDRLLTQLRQSGALDGVVGLALGEFTGCNPPAGAAYTLDEVLADLAGSIGVPVVTGLPVGHGARNWPVPLGARARLWEGGLDVENR